jgi:hypothetical protein
MLNFHITQPQVLYGNPIIKKQWGPKPPMVLFSNTTQCDLQIKGRDVSWNITYEF